MNPFHRLFPTQRRKSDLRDELQSHLNLAIADRIAQGESPEAARHAALREFGNVPLIADITRHTWGWHRLDQLTHDLRYAIRQLRRSPGFTLAVIGLLALGIGANAAIFTVLNGTLLRRLPYSAPSQLTTIAVQTSTGSQAEAYLADIEQWQQQTRTLTGIAYFNNPVNRTSYLQLTQGDQSVDKIVISANLVPLLGVAPAVGRSFNATDQQAGHSNVVLLSDILWRSAYRADPAILGKTIRLDDTPYIVAGVMPRAFSFPITSRQPQLWVPAELTPTARKRDFDGSSFKVIARHNPGTSTIAIQKELEALQQRLLPLYTGNMTPNLAASRVAATGYRTSLSTNERPALLALTAAVFVIWLIVCANVANLLLARSTTRRREFAVRGALGASRLRLIQQLTVESLLLTAAGSALGILVAQLLLRVFRHALTTQLSAPIALLPDLRVLTALLLLSVLTALLFGVVPAIGAARTPIEESLRQSGSQSGTGRSQHRTQRLLVVTEMALTLTMLVACGLLLRTVFALRQVPLGFRTDHVTVLDPHLPAYKYHSLDANALVYKPLLERVRAIPGVQAAALTSVVPLSNSFSMRITYSTTKESNAKGKVEPAHSLSAIMKATGPELQQVLGFRMLKGRYFTAQDNPGTPLVAVVNQAFEKQYREQFNKSSIDNWSISFAKGRSFKIIGILDDLHQTAIGSPSTPEIDLNAAQMTPDDNPYPFLLGADTELAIRSTQDEAALIPGLQRVMRDLNPDLAASDIRTMNQIVDDAMGGQLLAVHLLELCGALALTVALMGLYSLLAYLITLRTRELGLRMALGAQREQILTLVLRQAARLLTGGILLGIVISLATTSLLTHFLFGVEPRDIATIAAAALLMILTGILAAWLPARKAAAIEPMDALRTE